MTLLTDSYITMSSVQRNLPGRQPSVPCIYRPNKSAWTPLQGDVQEKLERDKLVKIVSWNIDHLTLGVKARVSAALRHLEDSFGGNPGLLVVMLQEVCNQSLQVILEDTWVLSNFVLSNNTSSPESACKDTPSDTSITGDLEREAEPYFTLMMTPRKLAISNCFRVPFITEMGRDALVVDIPVITNPKDTPPDDILRLCTTHLESLTSGKVYRPAQLLLITSLLKEQATAEQRIVAGLVGGDMNSIYKWEHQMPKVTRVGLKDVWDDAPRPRERISKSSRDLTCGRVKGNTFGYQSASERKNRRRVDKFFYTGALETVSIEEAQDMCGRLGRLGKGVEAQVETWMHNKTMTWVGKKGKGKLKRRRVTNFLPEAEAAQCSGDNMFHKTLGIWASDHFAITVGVKVKGG